MIEWFFNTKGIEDICKWDFDEMIIENGECYSEKSFYYPYSGASCYKLTVKHTKTYFLVTLAIEINSTHEILYNTTLVETTSLRKANKAIKKYLECQDKLVYFVR